MAPEQKKTNGSRAEATVRRADISGRKPVPRAARQAQSWNAGALLRRFLRPQAHFGWASLDCKRRRKPDSGGRFPEHLKHDLAWLSSARPQRIRFLARNGGNYHAVRRRSVVHVRKRRRECRGAG